MDSTGFRWILTGFCGIHTATWYLSLPENYGETLKSIVCILSFPLSPPVSDEPKLCWDALTTHYAGEIGENLEGRSLKCFRKTLSGLWQIHFSHQWCPEIPQNSPLFPGNISRALLHIAFEDFTTCKPFFGYETACAPPVGSQWGPHKTTCEVSDRSATWPWPRTWHSNPLHPAWEVLVDMVFLHEKGNLSCGIER